MNTENDPIRLVIPSDGALHDPTLLFMRSCGLGVLRTNFRRYTAEIPTFPEISVLFQRSADITAQVEGGGADLGIVGLDRYLEMRRESGPSDVIIDDLGFGQCNLVVGVPDSWVDVSSLADLADLAMQFRDDGRNLRIATKSPRLVEKFMLVNGVNYFSLIQSSGTLEIAPAMGIADVIADISSTGTTMRENRLKEIIGGTILTSEASLIGNRSQLISNQSKLAQAKHFTEIIESHLASQEYYNVTVNISGGTPEEVAERVLERTEISDLMGPTITKVYKKVSENWYAVTVLVSKTHLMDAISSLREIGGTALTVTQPSYVYKPQCKSHARLN